VRQGVAETRELLHTAFFFRRGEATDEGVREGAAGNYNEMTLGYT